MTLTEWRAHPEYTVCMNKIKSWTVGKTYTVNFEIIPPEKKRFMDWVLNDARKQGLLESVSIGLSLEGEVIEEKFLRK